MIEVAGFPLLIIQSMLLLVLHLQALAQALIQGRGLAGTLHNTNGHEDNVLLGRTLEMSSLQ